MQTAFIDLFVCPSQPEFTLFVSWIRSHLDNSHSDAVEEGDEEEEHKRQGSVYHAVILHICLMVEHLGQPQAIYYCTHTHTFVHDENKNRKHIRISLQMMYTTTYTLYTV